MAGKMCFVVLCALFGFVFANEQIVRLSDNCIAKLELDKASFEEWFHKRPVETDDSKYKCYFKCLFKEIKWMDDNGNIVEKPEIEVDEDLLSYGKQCMNDVQGSDECEKAYNFHKCMISKKEGE